MKINKKALELIEKGLSAKTVSKLTESQINVLHSKLMVEAQITTTQTVDLTADDVKGGYKIPDTVMSGKKNVVITPNPKFILSLSELKRHPGEKIDVDLLFPLNERIGIDIIGVEIGSEFSILGRVEAVSTGALLTVEIEADATGECVRCLDPIRLEIFATVQELFHFEPPADLEEDDDLPLLVTDDQIDILAPIVDAICLDLPLAPHCSESCLGLCPECGERLTDGAHTHEAIDPRWSALGNLLDFPNKE